MVDNTTYVYDADGLVLGRLASTVASLLLKSTRAGNSDQVVIVNAEKAIVSGKPTSVFATYHDKYALNHARKGPFFPRMPDQILKRTVRGMLPYQKNSTGRNAVRDLRVMIGTPANLSGGDLPDGHAWGDSSSFDRDLPQKFVRLGEISEHLGIDSTRWEGEQ